jgi:transposase
MSRRPTKRDFLRAARAWNEHARRVESAAFIQNDFFDPCDKVQVKYEMLRAHHVDGVSVTAASRQFGYSRESFYTAAEAFEAEGILGLVDEKRGPRRPRKLTPEVQRVLLEEIDKDPSVSSAELAERVGERFGVSVHRRSVERFRSAREKKKRRRGGAP